MSIVVTGPSHAERSARRVIEAIASACGTLSSSHETEFEVSAVRHSCYFTVDELATLWHPTTVSVRTPRQSSLPLRELEPPLDLPVFRREPNTAVLGRVRFRERRDMFGMREDDRLRHLLVVGRTGLGKSTLLLNLIAADLQADRGVALIDPHGDLAEAMLNYVPARRTNDVLLFDAADQEFPIGFNLLADRRPEQRPLVASGIVSAFQKQWGDSWGPRLEYILRYSLLTLFDMPGTTLVSLLRLLTDTAYRKLLAGRSTDPLVRHFWEHEFARWKPQLQAEAIAPVLNKVGAFLSNPILRGIVGQERTTFDLRRMMDERRIMIVNLSKGRMGEDASALLGSLLVTAFQLAAMSRADTAEADRGSPYYLYVDEFQNFSTPTFRSSLSEARKFRLGLILAHQFLEQLDEETSAAVFGNVGSIVSFGVGGRDAEELAMHLGGDLTPRDLQNLPKFSAYARLLIDGVPSRPFSLATLPPPSVRMHRADVIRRVSRQRYAQPAGDVRRQIESSLVGVA